MNTKDNKKSSTSISTVTADKSDVIKTSTNVEQVMVAEDLTAATEALLETQQVVTPVVEINPNLVQNRRVEPKKHQFKDGEFQVPTSYKCTKCGAKLAVRQEVLIKRINNQFGGLFNEWANKCVCSHCKKSVSETDKLAEAKALLAKYGHIVEVATNEQAPVVVEEEVK